LPRVSEQFGQGHRIWVKRDDLTGSALSGNKLRKLEFVTAQAQAEGCNTLITCGGVQSNHCRATALVAAQLGMQSHLILRGDHPDELDGNLLLDYLAGAQISCYSRAQFSRELPELIHHWQDHYANRGDKAFAIPIGASDGIGVWGYIAAAEELANDMPEAGIDTAYWVAATGSGGTQAGLTLGAHLHGVSAQVWGVAVSDDVDYFSRKVSADWADWHRRYRVTETVPELAINTVGGYVAPGYGKATPEVFDCIAEVARLEGLVLDPTYTGKAFYGLLQEIKAGQFRDKEDIVFIHTGGIFGLFPQRHQFNFNREK
jgi:D-cysteine desulfhydrase